MLSRYWTVTLLTVVRTLDCYTVDCCVILDCYTVDCCQDIGLLYDIELLHCGLLYDIGLLHCGLLSRYWTVRGWTAVKVFDC